MSNNDGYKKRILFVGEASFLNTGFSTYYRELLPRLAETGKHEIAEFGSYASQFDERVNSFIRGRWKFYGNNPLNEEEQKIHNQVDDPHQPGQNTNQFGKYKFEAVCADFRPDIVIDIRDWWMCLSKETPIVTRDGIKNVEDIKKGDVVLTHTGSLQPVLMTMQREHQGTIYKIRASHCGLPIRVTEEHPILASIRPNKHWKNHGGHPDFRNLQPQWTKPGQLSEFDFVCFPVPQHTSDLDIPNQLARLVGYYMAEGCMLYEGKKEKGHLKGVQLVFGLYEPEFISDVCQIIREEFGLDASVKLKRENTVVIRVFGKNIAEFMSQVIPGVAGTKSLHSDYVFANSETILQILCGYFRGDGGLDGRRGYFCTKSRSLAFQVFLMSLKLGLLPSWNLNRNTIGSKEYWRYLFSFAGTDREGYDRIVQGKFPDIRNEQITDDYAFLSIRDIRKKEDNLTVYNFEVAEDNSYVSSFALHNCAYQQRSPFREYFKWLLMPTVDSIPQNEQWISTYVTADYLMAYSDFGIDALRKSSPHLELRYNPEGIDLVGRKAKKVPGKLHPAPLRPGVDLETFRPMNKRKLREEWGLNPDNPIIAIVQRNQARKRIPEAIQAFAYMKEKYKGNSQVDKAILLLHTAWPENVLACDYPRVINRTAQGYHGMKYHRKEIFAEVLNTFLCHNCGYTFIAHAINLGDIQHFQGALPCGKCQQVAVRAPNTGLGYERDKLAEVYAMSDILLQMSIAEGCGMPVQEAKACGTMVLVTDYAAIAEKGRIPDYDHINTETYDVHRGGDVIKVDHMFEESETRCWRANTSVEDAGDQMAKYLMDPELREQKQAEARECAEEHYDWDKNWKEWEFILDHIKIKDRSKTWDKPVTIIDHASKKVPNNLDDKQFIEWCYKNLLNQDTDPKGLQDWLTTITTYVQQGQPNQEARRQVEQYFRQIADGQNTVEALRAKHLKKDERPEKHGIRAVVFQ